MLPQFGLAEFLLLAAAALIVVGPKDLPLMMRRLGQMVSRGRAMAREFQGAFNDIAKQAELDELRKEIEDLKRNNAVTEAQESLRAVEDDINASVMRKSGVPQDKAQPSEAAEPAETEEPTPAERATRGGTA